tara:strand:- start:668 stop:2209 length:1542 start_codon:yes stop_codon:yes gene_type:complete
MARIVLQQAPTGLDTFLEEVAKYASPEYQLRKREAERADARLELSRRQQQQVEERYEDSLTQQQFSNDLASRQEDRLQNAANINEENNLRTRADKTFTDATSGFGVQELIDTPTEAFLADITDPKERMLVERRVNSLKTKAGAQRTSIMKFKDDYNKRNPDNEISDNTAMVLFGDPEEHAKHLSRVYLDRDAGKMNDFQKGQVNFFTKQIGRMSKTLTDLETKEASLPGVDYSLQKEELQLDLSNAYSQIEKILNISNQGDSSADAYGGNAVNPYSEVDAKIEEFKQNPAEVLARTFNTQNVNEDDYNILFADDNEIGENVLAQIQANQNATDDSEVSINAESPDFMGTADEPEEDLSDDEIKEMRNLAVEEGQEDEVQFLDRLLSGVSGVQAKTPPKSREPKDFDVPRNLRDARAGSEFLKDKIKKLRKDIKTSETAPNPQTRKNFKEGLPKKIKELKELFSSIYDESTDTFYDDNSEAIRRRRERFPVLKDKPLSYRELLGDDLIKFINSL